LLKKCTSGEPKVNVGVNVVLPLVNLMNVIYINYLKIIKKKRYINIHYKENTPVENQSTPPPTASRRSLSSPTGERRSPLCSLLVHSDVHFRYTERGFINEI